MGVEVEQRSRTGDTRRNVVALLVLVVVAAAAGFVGNLLQGDDVGERYLALDRPAWAPPQEAFGIVWPVLYLLIAIAAWQVWRTSGGLAAARGPLTLWAAQLVVNAVWPGVFFGAGAFWPAVAVILLLDVLVVGTLVQFWQRSMLAGVLLLPYLAWIFYATGLNLAIALAN
ncbi:tryptophan-rich sensory protein [Egicoccus halophilus]|uniref:Tryptophan-rich sensory protein n=1 Tax=Egicoccus halophilus TaxID=1670830 RepID=A0A8J3A8C7_9ACTN|nr:tryptophan-rich sensory protein [Egicoccus halophilus]